MKWLIGIILLVAVAAGGWWLYTQESGQDAQEITQSAVSDIFEEEEETPEATYSIDAVETTADINPSDEDLPAVPESDPTVAAWLNTALGPEVWPQLLRNQNLVRRAVATVENLDARKLPERINVFESPDTDLVTEPVPEDESGQTPEDSGAENAEPAEATPVQLTAENAVRYEPWIEALQQIQDEQVIKAYVRYYPLFQKAYDDLGKDGGYFNDRLVGIIEHLLAAPEVEFPILLLPAENERYIYAYDPLESLSVGQKALVRMGPQNAGIVKSRLRSLHDRLTGTDGAPAVNPSANITEDTGPTEDLDEIEVDLSEPLEKMPMEEVQERFNSNDGQSAGGPEESEAAGADTGNESEGETQEDEEPRGS